MAFDYLVPYPQQIKSGKQTFARPKQIRLKFPAAAKDTAQNLKTDLRKLANISANKNADFVVDLKLVKSGIRKEGYRLDLNKNKAAITACENTGLFYGTQTLLQIMVLNEPEDIQETYINDWPQYRTRSFMVDMGRAVYPLPLIERIVRILARLKMNTLHLHLCDDQLNSLKYNKLPLGSENPHAITLAELKKLIAYARKYHVTVMPEIECWGHAGSFLYHYPGLYGAPGMWGGMSFGMGEPTFELFEKVFDELIPVLEKDCMVHVGLDEAIWAILPDVPERERNKYSPTLMVQRLYDSLMKAGRKHGRNVTMHLWADHGGRPLPEKLKKKVVIEPWKYFECEEEDIKSKLRRFGGKGKTPMMMGAGMSSGHFSGHFGATSIWAQRGKNLRNVEGITICHWESNALDDKLLGLYAGADHAWTPGTPKEKKNDPVHEKQYHQLNKKMRKWQVAFKDADREAILMDRGPEVYEGYYCWGGNAGKPVAPTVKFSEQTGTSVNKPATT